MEEIAWIHSNYYCEGVAPWLAALRRKRLPRPDANKDFGSCGGGRENGCIKLCYDLFTAILRMEYVQGGWDVRASRSFIGLDGVCSLHSEYRWGLECSLYSISLWMVGRNVSMGTAAACILLGVITHFEVAHPGTLSPNPSSNPPAPRRI